MSVEKLVSCLSMFALALAVVAAARWAGVLAMPADDYQEEFRDIVRVLRRIMPSSSGKLL